MTGMQQAPSAETRRIFERRCERYLRRLLPGLGAASSLLAEGLLISGWVAMWRPIELFLYEWWPLWRQQRLYRRLHTVAIAWRARPAAEPR